MKQFIAVMKDSYREARDCWIIYMMVGLSGLLILLALGISYRPLTMEAAVRKFPDQMNSVLGIVPKAPGQPLPPKFGIENFQQTNDASDQVAATYAWDFVLSFEKESDKEAAKSQHMFSDEEMITQLYRD